MANLHLVTGFAGYEHIKATDQAAFNAALIGTGQFVLEKGGIFEAQVHTNNLVRVLDGELMMQGRFIRLDPDTYVDLEIENGEQGKLRNDIIVARYTKDISTGVEECNLVVIKGEAVASNPADPAHEEGDITNGVGTVHDFPLWRLPIDGINVGEPVALYGEIYSDSMLTLPGIRHSVETIHAEVDQKLEEHSALVDEKIAGIESYTKEETLTDDVKAEYGKDSSAVPNDLFRDLADSTNKVGDIKVSIRDDLGEKWLLANGSVLDVGEYPDLANLLPEPTTSFSMQQSNIPAYYKGSDYANGICVAFGTMAGSNRGTYMWTGSFDGLDKYTALNGNNSYYHAVRYDEGSGTWVAAFYGTSTYAYATTDPVNGTWTTKTLDMGNKFADMDGHNGVWVAVGVTSTINSSRVVTSSTWVSTTTDPVGGTWSAAKQVGSRGATSSESACVHYHDGMWVIATGYQKSQSEGSGGGIAVYTTTDPINGAWTMQEITVPIPSRLHHVRNLVAHDGLWVMQAYDEYESYMFTTRNPAGSWESAKPTSTNGSSASYGVFAHRNCLEWFNGKWYAMGNLTSADAKLYLFTTTDPTGKWVAMQELNSNATGQSMCADGNTLIMMYLQGTTQNLARYIAKKLPTISTDGAYSYIKAKE